MPPPDLLLPGSALFTAGSACTGMYRGLKLWEAAVNETGSLEQADVVRALDHAVIPQGPGGPAQMVPGQHHLRLNMYIAQSRGGSFEVLKHLGPIEPQECEVSGRSALRDSGDVDLAERVSSRGRAARPFAEPRSRRTA